MQTYLVGGAVRDQLLDYPYHERDWVVVGATPKDLLDQGYQQVGKDFPVFLHPESKEEYALARKERKSGTGYHGFICDFGPEVTLEEDLQRRDLTINAMAQDTEGHIVDPYGGQRDLQQRRLRHVSEAFSEDPLRVLRVARFAARYKHLGFRVADDTLALMQHISASGELATLSAERLWVEMARALGERDPGEFFRVLKNCGALTALFDGWDTALSDALLSTLDQAQDLSVEARFALSASDMEHSQCRSLCDRLKVPNQASNLAVHCARLLPLCKLPDADEALAMLESLDYLRRPEVLGEFLQVARHRGLPTQEAETLARAANALRSITAQALMTQGYKGRALGEALREQRRETLQRLLNP